MICPLNKLCEVQSADDSDLSFEEIAVEELNRLRECNRDLDEDVFRTLDAKRFRCFALVANKQVVAYAWTGRGVIPAEHNCNGHPWTGLSFQLSPLDAYLFSAYVKSDHRGRRLYQSIVCKVAELLLADGVQRLILTTDALNSSSLRAVERMGFVCCGSTRFIGWLGLRCGRYKMTTAFTPNNLGFYVGDTRRRHD